jgi:hypothetical protein
LFLYLRPVWSFPEAQEHGVHTREGGGNSRAGKHASSKDWTKLFLAEVRNQSGSWKLFSTKDPDIFDMIIIIGASIVGTKRTVLSGDVVVASPTPLICVFSCGAGNDPFFPSFPVET